MVVYSKFVSDFSQILGLKSAQNLCIVWYNRVISIIQGVRMLDGKATDALEASSLGFQLQYVDVFSNCWGPKDDGKTFGKPGPLAAKALKRGAETVIYNEIFPVWSY